MFCEAGMGHWVKVHVVSKHRGYSAGFNLRNKIIVSNYDTSFRKGEVRSLGMSILPSWRKPSFNAYKGLL